MQNEVNKSKMSEDWGLQLPELVVVMLNRT